jgi:hypothetical protein
MVSTSYEKEREKQIIKEMGVRKVYRAYIKRIEQRKPVKIRIHHLPLIYSGIKYNEWDWLGDAYWLSTSYMPAYNQKLLKQLLKKVVKSPTSKIKVVADWDIICDFCPKHFYVKFADEGKKAVHRGGIIGWQSICDNSEQVKNEMVDFKYYLEGRIKLNSIYSPRELLALIFEAYKPNI